MLNHARKLGFLTVEKKLSEINRSTVFEPDPQNRLSKEADEQDRIEKFVDMTEKQLEQCLLGEGLLTSEMQMSQTIYQALHRSILPTQTNIVESDDE